jgi:proteasome lid subunit RPN8/RPN11
MITLSPELRDVLFAHARREAPVEACGYLGGRREANGDLVISRYLPLTNADGVPEHFSFLPAEQFAAVKKLRAEGLAAVAIWHSHPVSPARPSAEDIRLAFDPSVAWLIATLLPDGGAAFNGQAGGNLPHLRAWWISQGTAREDELRIAPAAGDSKETTAT